MGRGLLCFFINRATCLKRLRMHGLHILEDQTKKLREVKAAQLLYRCEHLCVRVLIFRVVSPSLG